MPTAPRLAVLALTTAAGCCAAGRGPFVATTRPVSTGLPSPSLDDRLGAAVVPPIGWRPDPVKLTPDSRHQVWISPGQATAYGVIAFHMPLPVGDSIALWGVLKHMAKVEGEAKLLDRRDDPALPGIRFVVEGGPYVVRGNLSTDGLRGWVVYAGTLRRKPVDAAELRLAEQAREATRVAVSR